MPNTSTSILLFAAGELIIGSETLLESKLAFEFCFLLLLLLTPVLASGLVAFHYPGAHDLAIGELEVMGIEGSKETLEADLGIVDQAAGNVKEQIGHLGSTRRPNLSDAREEPQQTTFSSSGKPSPIGAPPPGDARPGTPTYVTRPKQMSRHMSRDSVASDSFASTNASIPTPKYRSSGKLRKRLTATSSRIKQYGSIRSLTNKAQ